MLRAALDHRQPIRQSRAMNALNRWADPIYSILRIIAGLMFLCHGLDKILGTFSGKTAGQPLMVAGGWIELVCGALIALGLVTRIAALIASGEMAVAFFMMHASRGGLIPYVNKGELAVIYCFVFFYIFFRGPGLWSIDSLMDRRGIAATPVTNR